MRRLVGWVSVAFAFVSVLTLVRGLQPDSTTEAMESFTAPTPAKDSEVVLARDLKPADASLSRAVERVEPVAHHDKQMDPPAAQQDLALGLKLGFTRKEAMALVESVELEQLEIFFRERSHIDTDWLHRNGLSRTHLRELYARWASGSAAQDTPAAPGSVMFSRFSPGQDGGPYRIQDSFRAQDRMVFVHYQVPEQYAQASVVIRWTRQDDGGLSHFDYHPLTSDPGQRQEAWVRPLDGWEPGVYRVEVYGTEPSLPLIAQQDYEVFK